MTEAESRKEATLSIYIPAKEAAVCSDCWGVFLLTARHCPGCGSAHWSLLHQTAPQAIAIEESEEDK